MTAYTSKEFTYLTKAWPCYSYESKKILNKHNLPLESIGTQSHAD